MKMSEILLLFGHCLQGFRFFQDWWAEVTHVAKNGGSFAKMKGPGISKLTTVGIWVVYFTYTVTQTLVCIDVYSEEKV